MPKTTQDGQVDKDELPSTLRRSPSKAQATFAKVHDSAARQYGEGRRAYQTAYAALKASFDKVGDRWQQKGQSSSPERSPDGPSQRPRTTGRGGSSASSPLDDKATKGHLMERARQLDIRGRSSMTKSELAKAIAKADPKATGSEDH